MERWMQGVLELWRGGCKNYRSRPRSCNLKKTVNTKVVLVALNSRCPWNFKNTLIFFPFNFETK